MIKYPVKLSDLHNNYMLIKLNDVVDVFRTASLSTGLEADTIILEDFGNTVVQNAWTDDTGWYVTYRLQDRKSTRLNSSH